ncbi:hypothetical protein [Sporosarcina ureilytica]|uniref:Uncharacterized protein n=1 Tax=Sporosarcina ureilytica TaxID=298596 RepID=A0A1D8JEC9_9BACL|nr:hypothetical protein [Sporosarcina ureilytica]AOV07060.1 hypothetical protein BI350_05540 [Sporosarcina ureilytica]
MKRFMYYFVWVLFIGIISYLGSQYYLSLKSLAHGMFDSNLFIIYSLVFPVIIGMLLKLPGLIKDIKQQKKWTFDWVKLLAIGAPTFFIVTSPVWIYTIWTYTSLGKHSIFADFLRVTISTPFTTAAGIVLGYCLLDILKR